MANKRPSRANEKFYAKQAAEFYALDRGCRMKHMTRAQYAKEEGLRDHNGIKEERSAYGLHRGTRGVLLDHPSWETKCWIIFLARRRIAAKNRYIEEGVFVLRPSSAKRLVVVIRTSPQEVFLCP